MGSKMCLVNTKQRAHVLVYIMVLPRFRQKVSSAGVVTAAIV